LRIFGLVQIYSIPDERPRAIAVQLVGKETLPYDVIFTQKTSGFVFNLVLIDQSDWRIQAREDSVPPSKR
jgi:hypothetical protein